MNIPTIPGTLIHSNIGGPSQCHRCGWEGVPNSGEEHNLCPACHVGPATDAMFESFGDHTRFLRNAKPVSSVPRNSPCPCGSGKKYKKCCEAKNA